MRNAEQAAPQTGWSRNERCEAESRQRRGAGWTPAPVAAQPDSLPVELDPSEVADHLTVLLALGWTLPLLELETGVSQEKLRGLHAGRVLDAASTAAVASFGLGCRAGQRQAPALGPWRRIQALTAMGWCIERQAEALSVDPGTLRGLRSQELIDAQLWLAIESLYDRWSMRVGPDMDLLERARSAGVTPPLGWDDDEIDHPSAKSLADVKSRRAIVDEAVIERRCGGDTSVAICPGERAEITRIAVDEQWPAARLALVLDIDEASAARTLRRWRAADRENAVPDVVPADHASVPGQEQNRDDHEGSLDDLTGPTAAELDELDREHSNVWIDLADRPAPEDELQLALRLVVDTGGRRNRARQSLPGFSSMGGGGPGLAEQLSLELTVAPAC